MRALIVDASKSACVYRLLLEQYRITIEEAHDASTALQCLQKNHFDLLIFAYDLPDLDGLSFYSRIPAQHQHKELVSLLITSRTDSERLHQALELGVTGCFSKTDLQAIERFIENFAKIASLKIQGKVLLIEDSAVTVKVYGDLLKSMGLQFDHCTDAETAISMLKNDCNYDLIITDFTLSGVADAFSVIQTVRGLTNHQSKTPILVMSAMDTPARRTQLLLNGANEFFYKNHLPEELMVRVSHLIQNQRLLQRIEDQSLVSGDLIE